MKSFKQHVEACWDNYKQIGTKKKNGKEVPNCVPEDAAANSVAGGGVDMNPTGYSKRDKRRKLDNEQMFRRANGTRKIKSIV